MSCICISLCCHLLSIHMYVVKPDFAVVYIFTHACTSSCIFLSFCISFLYLRFSSLITTLSIWKFFPIFLMAQICTNLVYNQLFFSSHLKWFLFHDVNSCGKKFQVFLDSSVITICLNRIVPTKTWTNLFKLFLFAVYTNSFYIDNTVLLS